MRTPVHRGKILLAVALALLVIVLPYLIAARISPEGTVFSGFLINPIDGFSYLAKMRQGYEGSWLFTLPYAANPGEPTFLFVFYLALGHLSRVMHAPLIFTYHAARVVLSIGFYILLYIFFDHIFDSRRLKWAGVIFCFFGSGLGWLGLILLGRQPIDLWVPEGFPLLSAYSNAHFPLAAGAFIAGVLIVYRPGDRKWWHYVLAFVCGSLIGAVLPFTSIPMFLALTVWILWEALSGQLRLKTRWILGEPLSLLVLIGGALPWLLYDFWLSLNHPVISVWNTQNLTPSPPLIDTLVGFGPVFFIALVSLFWRPWKRGRWGRLLTVWFVLGFLLLYAPLPFQRRLSMGLYLPMAGLTSWWLGETFNSERSFRLAQSLVLSLSLPSVLLVIFAGLTGVFKGERSVVHTTDELEAYDWIASNVPDEAVVLTNPLFGNRLPAFASVRVLYGHPFETPRAEFWERSVLELLNDEMTQEERLSRLEQYGVDWLLIAFDSRFNELTSQQNDLIISEQLGDLTIMQNGDR